MLPTRMHQKPSFNRGLIAETGEIPNGYKLIQDSYPLRVLETKKTMVEHVVNGKKTEEPIMRITGLYSESDRKNANGRIYERPILANAIATIQEDVSARAVYGEYDHP